MAEEWVVLLEAVGDDVDTPLDLEAVRRLIGEMAAACPSGLYAPDRYAVQLFSHESRPEAALNSVVSRWQRAARQAGLPPCELVRAEVKTLSELQAEHDAAERMRPTPGIAASAEAAQAAYHATRALLRIRSADDVMPIFSSLVYSLGGSLVPVNVDDPWALDIDASFGLAQSMVPAAEPLSVARLHLEEILPSFVEDARQAIARATEQRAQVWRALRRGR